MITKRTRRIVLPVALSIVLAAMSLWTTPVPADNVYDDRDIVFTVHEKVGESREIQRTPLFDNAPFLKLKAGDQLVKAKKWNNTFKGYNEHFDKDESYFLLSDSKYYWLSSVREKGDQLLLSYGSSSLHFDWDVTLANATTLYRLGANRSDSYLSLKSFTDLKSALRKDFPESLRGVGKVRIDKPHLTGEGKTRRAVFQGIEFNSYGNVIYKYQFAIGNDTYIKYQKDLIVGPRIVEPFEFAEPNTTDDESREVNFIPNLPLRLPTTLEERAIARAEFERMKKFQAIVDKFLIKPPSNNRRIQ